MGRSIRSARSQATRTYRRETLKVPEWQVKADEARYAALAAAAAGPSVEPNRVPEEQQQALAPRGRRGKVASDDVDMEGVQVAAAKSASGKKNKGSGKPGAVKGGGVQKRKPGKLFAIGQMFVQKGKKKKGRK